MAEVIHGYGSDDQINAFDDRMQVYGLSGNDTLMNDNKVDALLVGGSGDDVCLDYARRQRHFKRRHRLRYFRA